MKIYTKILIKLFTVAMIITLCIGCSGGNEKPDIDLSGLYMYSLYIPKEGDSIDLVELDREGSGYPSTLEIIDNEKVIYDDKIEGSLKQKNGNIIITIRDEEFTFISLENKVLEIQSSEGSVYKLNQIDKSRFDRYMYRDTFTHGTLSIHPRKGEFKVYNTDDKTVFAITSDEMMVYIQSVERSDDDKKNEALLEALRDQFFVDPAKVEKINDWDTYFYEGEGSAEGKFFMDCVYSMDSNYIYFIRMGVIDAFHDIDDDNIHKTQIVFAQSKMEEMLNSITFSEN